VRVVAEQASKADALVDEAIEVAHGRSDPLSSTRRYSDWSS